jgi:hypothetical protein
MTKSSKLSFPNQRRTLCGGNLRALPDQDAGNEQCARHSTNPHLHLVVLPLRPNQRTIEAFTNGDDRRAHAAAVLAEIPVGVFSVTPFRLREICGPHVPWAMPRPGEPIATALPILNSAQARLVLAAWASWTFAHNATPYR